MFMRKLLATRRSLSDGMFFVIIFTITCLFLSSQAIKGTNQFEMWNQSYVYNIPDVFYLDHLYIAAHIRLGLYRGKISGSRVHRVQSTLTTHI